jgi:hypothetical protein
MRESVVGVQVAGPWAGCASAIPGTRPALIPVTRDEPVATGGGSRSGRANRCEVIGTHLEDDINGQAEQLAQELPRARRGVHGRAQSMKKETITRRSGIRFRMGPVWVAPVQKIVADRGLS